MADLALANIDADAIDDVRAFNRFYTNRIGVLARAYLDTPYTLTEARVIHDLAASGETSASRLADALSLDPAYLSRMVKAFVAAGILRSQRDPADGRGRILSLTPHGRTVAADLAERSRRSIGAMIAPLDGSARRDLTDAMRSIRGLLLPEPAGAAPAIIRPHRIGDMGLVIASQARGYAEAYGWNTDYEALVAEICARFLRNFDPTRERCWIAEKNDCFAGSIFLVKGTDPATAKLRLLHVAAAARGEGLGRRLVETCIAFARETGYRRLELWTNDILVSARRIYKAAGFRLEVEEPHHSFGKDLVGQTWALDLTADGGGPPSA